MNVLCHPKQISLCDSPQPSLDHRWAGSEPPILKEGNPKNLHLKPSVQGRSRFRIVTLLPILTIVTPQKVGTGTSHHTNGQNPKRQGLYISTCETYTRNIPSTFFLKFLCFGWPAFDFSYWHVYSHAWNNNFDHWNVFFKGDMKGFTVGWRQRGVDSWLGIWKEVFQMGIWQVSFFICRKRLEVVDSLVPLRYTMIKLQDSIIDIEHSILMRVWPWG